MSQSDFGVIDPSIVDGTQLAGMLNNWRDAVHTWHRGATPPAYVVPGMMWINDAGGAANWVLTLYVSPSVGHRPVFTYNTTTGAITLAAAAGTGQVSAGGLAFTPTAGADQVMIFGTVISGNAGSWFNTGNGRYTPPVGRYFIQTSSQMQAPSGGNGTWTVRIRKNGTNVTSIAGSGAQSFNIPITLGAYLDASGTDFFDFVANAAVSGMTVIGGIFNAFRIS